MLFHNSPRQIKEIYESELFGYGLFFAARSYSLGPANFEYSIAKSDLRIVSAYNVYMNADEDNVIVSNFAQEFELDNETALKVICERKTAHDVMDDFELAGEASWKAQGALLKLAVEAGFDAVQGEDEQGAVWIVDGRVAIQKWEETELEGVSEK